MAMVEMLMEMTQKRMPVISMIASTIRMILVDSFVPVATLLVPSVRE